MTNKDEQDTPPTSAIWVLIRLLLTLCLLLLLGLSAFGLHTLFDMPGEGVTITISLLFGLPFSLGAMATYLNNPSGSRPMISNKVSGVLFALTVLVLGGLIIREGVICMLILSPLWMLSAAMGSGLVGNFQDKFRARSRLNCSILIGLPAFLLFAESFIPAQTTAFTVERSIVIEAPLDVVWRELPTLDEIDEQEGGWNITQNLLGIPKPRSAIVVGAGIGAVRQAKWGDNISFEEHVFEWEEEERMRWKFVFPNSSVHKYTDQHISPDGEHLKVVDVGYLLSSLGPSQTKLVLDTSYEATTPVNLYSSFWGEMILGDIQANVLHIIKDRIEGRQQGR